VLRRKRSKRCGKYGLKVEHQVQFPGGNAHRLCNVQRPRSVTRKRVTPIERCEWRPTAEKIRASLLPQAALTRVGREIASASLRAPLELGRRPHRRPPGVK
jgi:hypothetical protein